MAHLSWQGRQRSQISFEVKKIVTSKAGQRMGLDWEKTFYLDVLRGLKNLWVAAATYVGRGMLYKPGQTGWTPQKVQENIFQSSGTCILQALLRWM